MKSSDRKGAKVRLLAVHTTEGLTRCGDLRAFFDRADAEGSSHAAADDSGALHGPAQGFVPYARAAWTLRNGNPVSDNLEYCGWAHWTTPEWHARPKGLDAVARWLAERSAARGIPLVKLTPAEVAAGRSGVIGHVDWTQGMKDGTHWDPGPGFPWPAVIDLARRYATPATATPVFAVIGRIRECFDRVGGLALLGQPRGVERPTLDPAGRFQDFAAGTIYWHPLVDVGTAHEVHGEIGRVHNMLGREVVFGWPTTDERKTPDGVGRFSHFTRDRVARSIYHHPTAGTHPVIGGIRDVWADQGWERGPLGYPTSTESAAEGGIVQRFQRGTILWRDGRGTIRPA